MRVPSTFAPGSSGALRTSESTLPQHVIMYAVVAENVAPHQLEFTPAGGSKITVAAHSPAVHAALAPQARSQRPQFVGSVAVLVSQSVWSSSQSAVPTAHSTLGTPPAPA